MRVYTAAEARALELLRAGHSQRDVIRQVWGASSGSKYQKAAKELGALIARELG